MYPVGSKCVITWARRESCRKYIGSVVVVGPASKHYPESQLILSSDNPDLNAFATQLVVCVRWAHLMPLEDPDETIEDEQILELAK